MKQITETVDLLYTRKHFIVILITCLFSLQYLTSVPTVAAAGYAPQSSWHVGQQQAPSHRGQVEVSGVYSTHEP